ncbi:hypothetical protein EVAR_65914_1 [Eumeta japonica]|uniref:FP protein C-terminal domain-containing protein n=1 Tax=Eumeta variegata TaxID=151549 RepID=A0A4C1SAJ2_EUMVA|nr:hypothetical protein EVAR_65914_1 [Eumeta japonica]
MSSNLNDISVKVSAENATITELLSKCCEAARKHEYKYVWVKHGTIFCFSNRDGAGFGRWNGGDVPMAVRRELYVSPCRLDTDALSLGSPLINHILIELRIRSC